MSRGVLSGLGLALVVLGRGYVLGQGLLAPLPGDADHQLLSACIQSIPASGERGWSFDARVAFRRHPDWPARELRVELPAGSPGPAAGECWQYAGRVEAPRSTAARRVLLRDHLSGYARLDAGPLNHRLVPAGHGLTVLRANLARHIADQIADPAAAALLAALAVGATGEVSNRQWQVFNATGITHLVAISGLHVTFFALLAMAMARRLWRLAPRGWVPRRAVFAAIVGCVFALLYALLSGFSVPAQRTVVMLTAFLGLRECARHARPIWSMGVAAAAVLLYDPMAVLSAGFWLSFCAVAAIVLLGGGRLQLPAPLPGALGLQWVVSLALLPATVAIFGSFASAGLLVNLLAIPVFSLLLVPPILLATGCYLLPCTLSLWCGDALLRLAGAIAAWLWPALSWCADLPGALWRAEPPWSWYLLALPALLLGLLPVAPRLRLAALGLLGSVFLLRAPRPAVGELWIDARTQGSHATLMLRTHAHLLLLGTGEAYGSAGRRFARDLLPLLRATGYARIDLWLPGSLTRDTQLALQLAAAEFPVRLAMLPPATAPPPEMRSCAATRWQWDGIDFDLHSSRDGHACLLQATRGGHRIEMDEAGGAHLGNLGDGNARLVLDAGGLALRSALLQL